MLVSDEIPAELKPVINCIAREIYLIRGYRVSEDYNFWTATHPQEKEALASAITAFQILHDYCMDNVGQSFVEFFNESED